jgi:hypothetical protein
MQWISKTASSFVTEVFGTPLHQHVVPGVALQRSGILTKEQLLAFFEAGTKLICSADVKSHLRLAAADEQDVGDVITELQVGASCNLGRYISGWLVCELVQGTKPGHINCH